MYFVGRANPALMRKPSEYKDGGLVSRNFMLVDGLLAN
jgi:hypothetical protein